MHASKQVDLDDLGFSLGQDPAVTLPAVLLLRLVELAHNDGPMGVQYVQLKDILGQHAFGPCTELQLARIQHVVGEFVQMGLLTVHRFPELWKVDLTFYALTARGRTLLDSYRVSFSEFNHL